MIDRRVARFYSSDIAKSMEHLGPCWPSDPCAYCLGFSPEEPEVEHVRQRVYTRTDMANKFSQRLQTMASRGSFEDYVRQVTDAMRRSDHVFNGSRKKSPGPGDMTGLRACWDGSWGHDGKDRGSMPVDQYVSNAPWNERS